MCSSGKKAYASYKEAYDNLQKIREKNPFKHRGECNIYRCDLCRCYHLTKRPKVMPRKIPLKSRYHARIL